MDCVRVDCDWIQGSVPAVHRLGLDQIETLEPCNKPAKDSILAIKLGHRPIANKKLAAKIPSHGKHPPPIKPAPVLKPKPLLKYALLAGAGASGVSALQDEAFYVAVEGGIVVVVAAQEGQEVVA
jgi:hypothetical protein